MPLFLAVLSCVLTALSFPKFNLFFLAWVSLFPLLGLTLSGLFFILALGKKR